MVSVFDAAGVLDWCATCAYVLENGGGCAVYEDRPMMCRIFGASEAKQLRCPHGRGSSKPLTERQTAKLLLRYHRLFKDDDSIWDFHEKFWQRKRAELGGAYGFKTPGIVDDDDR